MKPNVSSLSNVTPEWDCVLSEGEILLIGAFGDRHGVVVFLDVKFFFTYLHSKALVTK